MSLGTVRLVGGFAAILGESSRLAFPSLTSLAERLDRRVITELGQSNALTSGAV